MLNNPSRGHKVTGRNIHPYNVGSDCKNASKREVSQDEVNDVPFVDLSPKTILCALLVAILLMIKF